MPSKVVWIAVLLTMVYWLGNAFGCASTSGGGTDNQNHQDLDKDRQREMFNPRADPDKAGAWLTYPDADYRYAQPADATTVTASDSPTPMTASLTRGLDRSDWEPVSVAPVSGLVDHPLPVLHHDWYFAHGFKSVREGDSIDQLLDAAFSGAESNVLAPANIAGLFAQPVAFGVDMVLSPLRVATILPDEPLIVVLRDEEQMTAEPLTEKPMDEEPITDDAAE